VSLTGLVAGLVSAAVFGVAAVGQARGVRSFDDSPDDLLAFVRLTVTDLGSWLVLVAYGVGFVLHAVAIQQLPLYLAQVLVAMSLPVTAVTSSLVERRLSGRQWGSVVVLTLGLVLVAAGAGAPGPAISSPAFAVAVSAGVVGLGLLALWGRHRGGALLGVLAGLGYAGTAIGVRGVTTPVDVVVVVAALSVPLFGVLAFWVYSLGMRRAVIATATAPMVGLQTLLPALLGIVFLQDRVRAGWWPALLVGLALATVAAISLTRGGERPEPVAGSV
jgi:drug/metabolite transporter (DMT)-like permease